MTVEAPAEVLRERVAALRDKPRDLSAWYQLAESLQALDAKQGSSAFEELGRCASELGAVALAVACVIRIREAGDTRTASALLDRIASTHCQGSKRVDSKQSSVPPAPPAVSAPAAQAGAKPAKDDKAAALATMKEAAKQARARAPKKLPPTPLVRFLSADDMHALVGFMRCERYQRGDVVVDVGDAADALYWIARGGAEVSKGNKLLGELRADAFFGEIALMGASTRTARVACLEESDVLVIPASAVGEMAVKAPSLAKVLASHARARLLSNVMRTSELFRRLDAEEKRSLLPHFESSVADDGEFILRKGAANESLYVLVAGACEVRDGDESVTTLGVGDGFGEMSMLGRKDATLDVVALGSVVLLRVSRDKFDEIAQAHPGLLAEVYKLLVAREKLNSDAVIHQADDLVI